MIRLKLGNFKLENHVQIAALVVVVLIGLSMVSSYTGLGFGVSPDVYRGKVSESSSVQFCSDSDTGLGGVSRAGTCRNHNGDFTDYCVSETSINEYFCQEYNCEANIVHCGAGNVCRDGRCTTAIP